MRKCGQREKNSGRGLYAELNVETHSNAERRFIDLLVDALYSGDSQALTEAGGKLAGVWQAGDSAEEINGGVMLEDTALIAEDIDVGGGDIEDLKEHVSEERYKEL